MAVNLGSLLVSLGLDSAEFKTGLSQAEKEFKRSTKRIEAAGKGMGDLGRKLSLAVTAPLVALGVTSVKAAVESNQAIKSVEATLASMGARAGFTAEQLGKVASDTMRKSLYDDDEVLRKVTNTMLTFGNVTGDTFLRAQQAAVDLSAKFGKDLQGSAIMVGKALQDPTKGLTALGRAGISFSPAQEKVIKSLVATGQAAKAQGIILRELERQVAGSAQAMRDADPLAAMRLAFGEFQEEIGKKLLPLLPRLTEALTKVFDAFGKLSPGMQDALIMGGALAAAFGPILIVVGSLTTAIAPFVAGIKLATTTAAAAGVAMNGLGTSLAVVRAALLTGLVAIAPWAIALGAVAAAVYLLTRRSDEGGKTSAYYRSEQEKLKKVQERVEVATLQLATATGKARVEAIANAKALKQETQQYLYNARSALMAAQAKAQIVQAENRQRLLQSSSNLRGAGGGIDPVISQGRQNRELEDQAYRDLNAANQVVVDLTNLIVGFDKTINSAAPAVSDFGAGAAPDKRDRPGRARQGPTAAEIEGRFQDELFNVTQQSIGAMQRLATTADERAELELRGVEWTRRRALAEVAGDKEYSAAQKAELSGVIERIAANERSAVERQRKAEMEREASDLAQVAFDNQRELLGQSADLADTQAERKRIALEILELEQQYRRNQLEMVAASDLSSDAEKARANAILASLGAIESGERASAGRRNETEVEAYLRNLKKSPEQINEAMDRIRIDGLDALNDGLAQALAGVRSLGEVFKNVANQIIADLLRIAIRRAIIEPLARALFPGQGGAGSSSADALTSLDMRGLFGGARALGGPVRKGLAYLVGEQGPEVMVAGASGSVIANKHLKGVGGGGIAQIVPSPYFDVVVDGRIVSASPSLMSGGAQIAQSRMAYRQTRRVG